MSKQSKNRQKKFSKTFKGKTISKVDAVAVNAIRFVFTDGTDVEIETEYFGHGIYGIEKARKLKLPAETK